MWTIYKVVCHKDPNTVYIGSTKRQLVLRLYGHRAAARLYEGKGAKWKWMLDNYYDLEIVGIRCTEDEISALFIERTEIAKHKRKGYNVLNKVLPGSKVLFAEKLISKGATLQEQYRKCGKKSCSTCRTGRGHGPYTYVYWHEGGKLYSSYLGKDFNTQSSNTKD